jgi:hypothetical protein
MNIILISRRGLTPTCNAQVEVRKCFKKLTDILMKGHTLCIVFKSCLSFLRAGVERLAVNYNSLSSCLHLLTQSMLISTARGLI